MNVRTHWWFELMHWVALLGAFPAPLGAFGWLIWDDSGIMFTGIFVALAMEAAALTGVLVGLLIATIRDLLT